MFYHVINSVFSSQILPVENIQSLWKKKQKKTIWSSDKERVELWEKENEGREEGWSCILGLPVMEWLNDIFYLSPNDSSFLLSSLWEVREGWRSSTSAVPMLPSAEQKVNDHFHTLQLPPWVLLTSFLHSAN